MPAEALYLTTDDSQVSEIIIDKVVTLPDGNQDFQARPGTNLTMSVYDNGLSIIKEGTTIGKSLEDEIFIYPLGMFLNLKRLFKLSSEGVINLVDKTFLRLSEEHPNKVIAIGFFRNAHVEGQRFDQISDIAN